MVSTSSAEVEYRSLTSTCKELWWVSYVLKDLQVNVQLPMTLFCDNKSAIMIANNSYQHERTKHIKTDIHFTRDQISMGFLTLSHINSVTQLAEMFTKPLPKHILIYQVGSCSISNLRRRGRGACIGNESYSFMYYLLAISNSIFR